MSGWRRLRRAVQVCVGGLFMEKSKKTQGCTVSRVIMLHLVAPEPQNLTHACQARVEESTGTNTGDSDIMVVAHTQGACSTHMHTATYATGMCPGRTGMPGREEAELIRVWVLTLWLLTPHSPPISLLSLFPAIQPRKYTQMHTHTQTHTQSSLLPTVQ